MIDSEMINRNNGKSLLLMGTKIIIRKVFESISSKL